MSDVPAGNESKPTDGVKPRWQSEIKITISLTPKPPAPKVIVSQAVLLDRLRRLGVVPLRTEFKK
jgi:hypothetical protein